METESRRELLEVRKSLEGILNHVVSATARLLEPLKGLSDEQRDAVVILGLVMRGIALAKRPPAKTSEAILVRFKEEINEICPPLGEVALSKDPCFEATVSYLLALKKCQDEGHNEGECPDAWGPGATAVMCTMKMIEEMKTDIGTLLGRQRPPKPVPWPVEHAQE